MRSTTSGNAMVAGVVGWPVAHSLSPLLHNAWIAEAGLDAVYIPLPVTQDGFAGLVRGLTGGVVRGLNVTIPHKEQALALAELASPAAARAGAANLLLFMPDGSVHADNTDGVGLLGALNTVPGFNPSAGPAVVLGAGGAARGAVAALMAAGAPSVRVVNRTRPKAEDLAKALGAEVVDMSPAAVQDANCLVNATALGLKGVGEVSVLWDALPTSTVVMDMVYTPLRTAFLQEAQRRGHPVVDGLEMLIRQAVPSFEAFYGVSPPPLDVRTLAIRHLEARK